MSATAAIPTPPVQPSLFGTAEQAARLPLYAQNARRACTKACTDKIGAFEAGTTGDAMEAFTAAVKAAYETWDAAHKHAWACQRDDCGGPGLCQNGGAA